MLFNSSEFIFIFLPLVVTLHFLVARASVTAAAVVTTLSSLVFYAYWNPPFALLPILSIGLNFLLARSIAGTSEPNAHRLMIAGVVANLAVLGCFKYEDFIIAVFDARAARPPTVPFTAVDQLEQCRRGHTNQPCGLESGDDAGEPARVRK